MIEYCISKNYFQNLKIISSNGRESTTYFVPNGFGIPVCIKEYANPFLHTNSNDEVIKKLFLLHQKLVKSKNIAPSIIFYDLEEYQHGKKKLIATATPFLQDYVSIEKVSDISDIFICIRNLTTLLMELTSLSIFPTDLNNSNIMVSPDLNVQLIDLDGEQCKVNPENPNEYYKQIFDSMRYRILADLMLSEEEYNAAYKFSSLREGQKIILRQKGYSPKTIDVILESKEEPKLETILEVLDEVEPFFSKSKPKK